MTEFRISVNSWQSCGWQYILFVSHWPAFLHYAEYSIVQKNSNSCGFIVVVFLRLQDSSSWMAVGCSDSQKDLGLKKGTFISNWLTNLGFNSIVTNDNWCAQVPYQQPLQALGIMCSLFICSFWHCIHCLLICLASPLTSFLWPPYEIGQAIIFLPCVFYLSIFYLSFLFLA